jgi:hypothetical protein
MLMGVLVALRGYHPDPNQLKGHTHIMTCNNSTSQVSVPSLDVGSDPGCPSMELIGYRYHFGLLTSTQSEWEALTYEKTKHAPPPDSQN